MIAALGQPRAIASVGNGSFNHKLYKNCEIICLGEFDCLYLQYHKALMLIGYKVIRQNCTRSLNR